jgi:hypothetical protein
MSMSHSCILVYLASKLNLRSVWFIDGVFGRSPAFSIAVFLAPRASVEPHSQSLAELLILTYLDPAEVKSFIIISLFLRLRMWRCQNPCRRVRLGRKGLASARALCPLPEYVPHISEWSPEDIQQSLVELRRSGNSGGSAQWTSESVGKSGHDIRTAGTRPEVYPEHGN